MMRILHLTRDFPPRSAGGISTAVAGLVRASLRAGLGCAVLSFDGWRPRAHAPGERTREPVPAREHVGPGEVEVLRVSAPAHLDAARAFARDLAPDLLHVHHDMLWPLAAELRVSLSVPAALTVHVLQAEQNRLRGIEEQTMSLRAQQQALAEADAVLAPSGRVAELLRREGVVPPARLAVAPLGIDDSDQARAAAAAPGRDGPVLYAGRFADINGTAELFAAIPRIAARVPGARFVIAGGLPENRKAEARWRKRWESGAPEEVRPRVRFTGWLPPDALAALYGDAALLLAPSWFETFGLVVLEAMLHGVPVAATRAGALAERIEHEGTGLLSAPRDVDDLVENAARLLKDRVLARRLAGAAAIEARRHLWDSVLSMWLEAYERARADRLTARR